MTSNPPITILMPIKNGERFLPQAIKFLEKNASPYDEILIVNDNSQDQTNSILMKWAKHNTNVMVVNNPKSGLVNALNFGLKIASHDWIARFDVDDRYPSSRIEQTRKSINKDAVAIFTDYQFTTDSGLRLGVVPSAIQANHTALSLVSSQRTAHPSVCFNKFAVKEVGGYVEEDFPAEDLSLWLRLSTIGRIITVPKNLLFYRLSRNSTSSKYRQKVIQTRNILLDNFEFNNRIFDECISSLAITKKMYDGYWLGKYRYLLHLRDLSLISNTSKNYSSSSSRLVRQKIYSEISNYPPAGKLLIETILRKLYRSL